MSYISNVIRSVEVPQEFVNVYAKLCVPAPSSAGFKESFCIPSILYTPPIGVPTVNGTFSSFTQKLLIDVNCAFSLASTLIT